MLSYHAVAEFLGGIRHQGRIAALYRELVEAPAPAASVVDMAEAILAAIEEAGLFPVHAHDVYDLRESVAGGDLPPFQYYVHFEGLDMDDEWEIYGEPVHLVMALMEGCGHGDSYEHVYSEEAQEWWGERQGEYDLPDIETLDAERVVANLKAQEGMPWKGLWAIWRWIECGTGNWFVDIPCSCSGELDLDVDWTIESVRMLQHEYEAAMQIFEPFGELHDLFRRASWPTLAHCFDIALDGCERSIPDDEESEENEVVDEEE